MREGLWYLNHVNKVKLLGVSFGFHHLLVVLTGHGMPGKRDLLDLRRLCHQRFQAKVMKREKHDQNSDIIYIENTEMDFNDKIQKLKIGKKFKIEMKVKTLVTLSKDVNFQIYR